ncbi:MAG: tail fiber domain-containing protein [Flavobacteriaceae bacterium]|jgi:hypothetical protein|nr:tail fiber domain-containing protein [Flavobacteriaceae bacterium]
MKNITYILLLIAINWCYAQVGVNTTTPDAILDVKVSDINNPDYTDGILIPRIAQFPATNPGANQNGMMVFLTTLYNGNSPGFYWWDNTVPEWKPIDSGANTLNQAYNQGGAGAGRIITAISGPVLVEGNDGLQVTGTFNSGALLDLENSGTRMFFYPRKAAFRAGSVGGTQWNDTNVGDNSIAFGRNTLASGQYGVAFGNSAYATAEGATAFGRFTTASGLYSTAFGRDTEASGDYAVAFGYGTFAVKTIASGDYSTAFGRFTTASAESATAFGHNTEASGNYSTAFGYGSDYGKTIASGDFSTAFGYDTTASGVIATAFGDMTVASEIGATAFGGSTRAEGTYSTAFGLATSASGDYATAFGSITQSSGSISTAFGLSTIASGDYATSFGYYTQSSGSVSTAFGEETIASGNWATAFGINTEASGNASMVLGNNNTASGSTSMVWGRNNEASRFASTAFGFNTIANEQVATAWGEGTNANGRWSTAFGYGNTANSELEVVLGRYATIGAFNPTDWIGNNRLFAIGNGSSDMNRNDAIVVLKNGWTGIGRNPTTNLLEVNGNASKTTAGDWLANSDKRLKKNIQTLSSKEALQKILSLRGVIYEWNDDQTGYTRPEGIQYGFIAQEIAEVFPENVTEDNQGYLQTAYGTYDALYVQSIKELVIQMNLLNAEITKLKAENESLFQQINNLKK